MDFDLSWDSVREKGLQGKLSKPQTIGILAIALIALSICAFIWIGPIFNGGLEVKSSDSSNSAASSVSSQNSNTEKAQSQTSVTNSEALATIAVHVTGEVANPGMYELQRGSRANDAINAAGGFTADADDASVNLARTVSDGEQIRVPGKSEEVCDSQPTPQNGSNLVNINTATSEQLQTINGIGPSTAQKIIEDRQSNGSFSSVDDLTRVSGIGDKKLESIRPYVTAG